MHKQAIDRIDRDLGDLLASHERGRSLDDFAVYRDDPTGFIRDVLHGEPWERQELIAKTVQERPLTVVRSCNGAGKDWLAGRLALWWVYARGGLALVTGPTERQVREVVMGEVARAFAKASDLPGELYQMALRLGRDERAGILAFTSTEASKLTGFHAPRVMAILTEAQGVEDFAWEGLLACATGSEDRVLAVGNPLIPSGRFFDVSRSEGWRSIRIPATDHPNLLEGREVIPGGVTLEFAQRMAAEYGEESGVYRARVAGEFPDESEDALCARSWIDAAVERWESGELDGRARLEPTVLSLDPARYGPDASVLIVMQGPVVREILTWTKKGLNETTGRVLTKLDEVESAIIVVDEPGLGGGVIDRLEEQGIEVNAYNGGRRAEFVPNPDRFFNRRAAAYWMLRQRLEDGDLALPPDDRLADELTTIRWKVNSSGQIQLEPKDRVRERLGRSPDAADALVAAVWVQEAAAAPMPSTEIVWDPSGLFTESPPGYVVDEDRATGWTPVRWQM
jgi:hypothetical protein